MTVTNLNILTLRAPVTTKNIYPEVGYASRLEGAATSSASLLSK